MSPEHIGDVELFNLDLYLASHGASIVEMEFFEGQKRQDTYDYFFASAMTAAAINNMNKINAKDLGGSAADVDLPDATKKPQNVNADASNGEATGVGNKSLNLSEKNITDLPENVQKSYSQYNKFGWKGNYPGQSVGTKAGAKYQNSNNFLPDIDAKGNAIEYREFDVNNKIQGFARDTQRFVYGSDGSVYYTDSHYGETTSLNGIPSFVKIK